MKFGVGIAGMGYVGVRHAEAVDRHPRARLVAVTTAHPNRAAEAADRFGTESCRNFDELVQRPDVEIVSVIVATPNELHADQVIAALAAGKHVLCEKPMVTTEEDVRRLVEAERLSNSKILVGQVCRFSPYFRIARDLCAEGKLGRPFHAEATYIHRPARIKPFWQDRTPGSFAVLGAGCHPVDLLRCTVGEVSEIVGAASSGAVLGNQGLHDTVDAQLRFENGCLGRIFVSLAAVRPYSIDLAVYGTEGTVINDRVFLNGDPEEQGFRTVPVDYRKEHPYFFEELGELIHAIDEDRPSRIPAKDGARTIRVCLAIVEAIRTGRPVPVQPL